MDYINIILAFSFIVAYAIVIYFHLKKLKEKTLQVIEGKIENKPLNKLISRARASSKNSFAVYMCFQGLLSCTLLTIVSFGMDLLIKSYEPGIMYYLFLFLFLFVVFTLTAIAKANLVWHQVNNMKTD